MSKGIAMFELMIEGDIASAHFLRGYDGPCKDLHGHTWKVKVAIMSDTLDTLGMVVDFKVVKKKLKLFLSGLDHVLLNDLDFFKRENPTTENLAKYIYTNFSKEISPLQLKKVEVFESDTSSVTYYP